MRLVCLATVALLLLAACAAPTSTAVPASATPAAIRPAVATATAAPSTAPANTPLPLTPTSPPVVAGYVALDGGTPGALDGVQRFGRDFGWSVQTGQDAEALQALAQAGAKVVVADGPGLEAATRAAAKANPLTHFVGVNQAGEEAPLPNLLTLGGALSREDQLGFVAGALAGLVSQGHVVSVISYPSSREGLKYRNGFLHGVRYACPRCRVDFIDLSGPKDASAADRARMNASLSSDVLFAAPGPAGLQGLAAAAQQGAWVIASGAPDAAQGLGDKALTSVYFDASAAVYAALAGYAGGKPAAGPQPWSAANGAVSLAPYGVSEEVLSSLDRQDIQTLLERLASGELDTGIDPGSGLEL